MEFPRRLRQAIDEALSGVALSEIETASNALSQRYRAEVQDDLPHLADDMSALAYLATRMPATFAAVHASLSAAAEALPGFAPARVLDVGAGPGTALWAAKACWPSLDNAELVEASAAIRSWGERFSATSGMANIAWRGADIRIGLPDVHPSDLVTLAYVLDELAPLDRDALVDRLWSLTAGMLVIVEPGTPRGWQRILAARARLIVAGAHIVAPCPHHAACPLIEPDWCHFSARVARSRVHRLAKGADVPWEDEKFIYLAASRIAPPDRYPRVLAPPLTASGRVRLKLCQHDGTAANRLVTRREGEAFKAARRTDWGDVYKA